VLATSRGEPPARPVFVDLSTCFVPLWARSGNWKKKVWKSADGGVSSAKPTLMALYLKVCSEC
jgi:hypothetical protein